MKKFPDTADKKSRPLFYTSRKILVLILSMIALISLCACDQENEPDQDIIARVGDREITREDFRQFYELDPNFGIDSSGVNALIDQLNKYIDRYLALQEAETEGLWRDPTYLKALNWEKKQAKLRQLYRSVVVETVKITKEEIKKEFLKQTIQVNVQHLFSKDLYQVQNWRDQLRQGREFKDIAQEAFQDSLLASNGGNLGWVKLNEIDPVLADTISLMEVNDISNPVQSQWGYHIIQLLDRRDQAIISDYDFNQKKESIEKQLIQKKSNELSSKYIEEFIGKLDPQLNSTTFRALLYYLVSPYEREKGTYTNKIALTNSLIERAEIDLANYIEKPLIEYYGGQISLAEYLHALLDVPIGNRPKFNSARQFSNQIGIWMRDELLIFKADEQNLETNKTVIKEIDEFRAEQSYYYYFYIEKEKLNVPEPIKMYYQSKNRGALAEKFDELSRFHGLEEWRWWKTELKVHQKLRSNKPPVWIDYKKLENENKILDWNNRIRMFMLRMPS